LSTIRARRERATALLTAGADAIIRKGVPDLPEAALPEARAEVARQIAALPPEEQARVFVRTLKAGGASDADVAEATGFPGLYATAQSDLAAHVTSSALGRAIDRAVVADSATTKTLEKLMAEVVDASDPERPDYNRATARVVNSLVDRPAVLEALVDAAHRREITEDQLSEQVVALIERREADARAANPHADKTSAELEAELGADDPGATSTPGVRFVPENTAEDIATLQAEVDALDNPKARPVQPPLRSIRPGASRY
jgi:hypothetical protein